MFCKNCGKELANDVKFCDACGADIAGEGENEQKEYTAPKSFEVNSVDESENPQYQKSFFKGKQSSIGTSGEIKFGNGKKKGGCLKAVLITLVVIVALIILFAFLGNSGISNVNTASSIDTVTFSPKTITSTFPTTAPEVYVTFSVSKLPIGTEITSEWIYITENIDITTAKVKTTEDSQNIQFNLSKPNKGWPIGDYEVKISANGEYKTSAKFKVE